MPAPGSPTVSPASPPESSAGVAQASPSQAQHLRAVLAVRGFRRILGIRLASQLADGWFQAGLGASVLFDPTKQTSPVAVATGFAVLLLPYSLIGPYVGVFLDRWSRRSVLYLTNLLRAALVVPVVPMIWADRKGPGLVVVALAIIGLNRLFLSGVNAATPHVVDDRRLVTANAVSGTLGSVCYSVGLGTSALLLKVGLPADRHGYAALAALAPLGYLASALLARASFAPDSLGPTAVERRSEGVLTALVVVGRGMIDGLRHLAARRGAAYALLAQAAFRVLFGILTLSGLLLYRLYFTHDNVSGSIAGIAQVFIGGSLGVLAGAFITPSVTRRIGGWLWIASLLVLVGATVLLLGLPFRPVLLAIGAFFINVAAQGIKIVVDTALQHECADEYRGRVFSVSDTSFNLCFVLGLFIAAVTLPPDGHSPTVMALIGVGYLATAAWYALVGGGWARRVGDDIRHP